MKNQLRILFFVSVLWFLVSACDNKAPSDFQLKGKIAGSNGEFISLVDINSSAVKTIDSIKVDENGEFVFTKKVPNKGFYNIQISPSNYATIIADSTEKIIFEGNAKTISEGYKITGSPDADVFLKFNSETKKNLKEMESIRMNQDSIRRVYEAYMNTTNKKVELDSLSNALEPTFNAFSEKYKKLADETQTYVKKFIDENSSSFASLAAVQMLSPERDIVYYVKVAEALTKKYSNVENLKSFQAYVDQKKLTAIGMPAPEIQMNDKDGKPIALSSLKGKVVVLDFWASWCKPCRAENPFVVELYNTYKSKGLDIYSVSLDFNKDAWLKAIDQDKLTWKNHVCDMKQWQSPVVALYGFTGIPYTCLIDKEGRIAGKNLQGPELKMKLMELLGENMNLRKSN